MIFRERNTILFGNYDLPALDIYNEPFQVHCTCVKRPLKKTENWFSRPIIANAGQKYYRMQYLRPSLSYHLPLRSLFCLFLSGRFTQVLLYQIRSRSK